MFRLSLACFYWCFEAFLRYLSSLCFIYVPSAVCCIHYAIEEDSLDAVEIFGTVLSEVS